MDPEILGGAIVRIGERIHDGSVRRRMAKLRRQLLAIASTVMTATGAASSGPGCGIRLDPGPSFASGRQSDPAPSTRCAPRADLSRASE